MTTTNNRQKRTTIWLLGATILSWGLIYLDSFLRSFAVVIIIAPVIYGFALDYSNKEYRKRWAKNLIPFFFFVIYVWGTLPFYSFSNIFFESVFLDYVFGCISAFALVFLVTKLTLKHIHVGPIQIVMTFLLPIICISILPLLKNQTIFSMQRYMLDRPDLLMLSYQFFMTILIVSSMKTDKAQDVGHVEKSIST
ncbi:MAG: hypothetical protein JWN56_1840 [Sphingobacteriales bacterium]|nr:hypothetical protein [Sphingobacteriales bacterium]